MRLPAAVLALLLAAACTSHDATHGGGPTPGPGSSSSTTSPNANPSPSTTAQARAEVKIIPDFFQGGFRTPSGNIWCEMFAGYLSCSIGEHTWHDPPPSADSCLRGGHPAVRLGRDAATMSRECGEPDRSLAVLAYWHGLRQGTAQCVSLPQGLECRDLRGRGGFFLSRSRVSLTQQRPAPAVRVAPSDPRALVVPAGFWGNVRTPTRNIFCHIDDELASCWSGNPPYTRPKGSDCQGTDAGDPTATIDVARAGRGHIRGDCWSDFPYDSDHTLAYGTSLTVGRMRCASKRSGMTCTNTRTGHGFFTSKAAYRLF